MPQNRRKFIQAAALASLALPLRNAISAPQSAASSAMPSFSIFSKHLQFLDYKDMASAAAAVGFDGIDLTVRPNGHVSPENVKRDLPKAHEAIKEAGLDAPMMTTAVDDANDPTDRAVLEQAAALGIDRYRMNWFPYPENEPLPSTISLCQKRIQKLTALNLSLGIIGCYQNHAGSLVGASLWEVWSMLQGSDPSHMGVQYDIRHATVEGGLSWPNGLKLVLPRIQTIVVKDFKWELRDGKTEIVNTPVGEGMVDFKRYFGILKDHKIDVPVSLHFEYDLGGAQWGRSEISIDREKVFEAMSRDLATTKRLWDAA